MPTARNTSETTLLIATSRRPPASAFTKRL